MSLFDDLHNKRMVMVDELEQILENCMAAGVPISDMSLQDNGYTWDGTTAHASITLKFSG